MTERVLLSLKTTFGVGGEARFLFEGDTSADIKEAKSFADDKNIPFIVLGGGSNVLADDGEMDAVFFTPTTSGIAIQRSGGDSVVVAAAGESWDRVVSFAVENGLFGIENLSGIPGRVGGAVVQNIGAYGAALSSTVSFAHVYDFVEKKERTLTPADCLFGYRNSIFKKKPQRFVLLRVGLKLTKDGKVDTSYRDLQEKFDKSTPDLAQIRDAVLSVRARKFPDLSVEGTAGSFFKNPIVDKGEAERLKERFPEVPLYIVPEEAGVKVPLAWFLDRILNLRGFTMGNVRCFESQPLVIVAKRGATATEVRTLAQHVAGRVQSETGLTILPEVCVLRGNTLTSQLIF